jgi:hypothetical protein
VVEIPVCGLNDLNCFLVGPRDCRCHRIVAGLEAFNERIAATLHSKLRGVRLEQYAESKCLLNIGLAPLGYVDALTGIGRHQPVLD